MTIEQLEGYGYRPIAQVTTPQHGMWLALFKKRGKLYGARTNGRGHYTSPEYLGDGLPCALGINTDGQGAGPIRLSSN